MSDGTPRRRSSRLAGTPQKNMAEEPDVMDVADEEDDSNGSQEEEDVEEVRPKGPNPKPQKRATRTQKASTWSKGGALQGILTTSRPVAQSAAKVWLEEYEANQEDGIAALLSFMVQAAGCAHAYTAEQVQSGDIDEMVAEAFTKAKEEGGEDFLSSRAHRHARRQFVEFWEKLVAEAGAVEALFDGYWLEKVANFAIAMNCNMVRSFRLAATIAAGRVSAACTSVMAQQSSLCDTAQRQLDALQRKHRAAAEGEAEMTLKRMVHKHHNRVLELKKVVASVFQGVFMHRVRDVVPDVRAEVVFCLGQWIQRLPDEYLGSRYLKYVAWALSDKDKVVRRTALQVLIELYDSKDNHSHMEDFTQRFGRRVREMVHDIDEEVAVLGIKLVTKLRQAHVMVDDDEQLKEIFMLLGAASPAIRHAAAAVAAQMVERLGRQELGLEEPDAAATSPQRTAQRRRQHGPGAPRQAARSPAEVQLAGLVKAVELLSAQYTTLFFESMMSRSQRSQKKLGSLAPARQVVGNVVEALHDKVDVLTHWRALVDLLLDEDQCESWGKTTSSTVASILYHSARLSHPSVAPSAPRRQAKARPRADGNQELTVLMIRELPGLLQKYQTHDYTVEPLVQMVELLNLEMFVVREQESELEALLKQVASVFFKHGSGSVLTRCGGVLAHCQQHAPAGVKAAVDRIVASCLEGAAEKLKEAVGRLLGAPQDGLENMREGQEVAGSGGRSGRRMKTRAQEQRDEEDVIFSVELALIRVHQLVMQPTGAALAQDAQLQSTLELVFEADEYKLEDRGDAVGNALRSLFFICLWLLKDLQDQEAAAEAEDASEARSRIAHLVNRVVGLRDVVMRRADEILNGEICEMAQDRALHVVFDLLLVFGKLRDRPELLLEPGLDQLKQYWLHVKAAIERMGELEGLGGHNLMDESSSRFESVSGYMALVHISQLVAYNAVGPHLPWLASRIVALIASPQATLVEVPKAVCRRIREHSRDILPEMYLAALKQQWEELKASQQYFWRCVNNEEDEDEEDYYDAFDDYEADEHERPEDDDERLMWRHQRAFKTLASRLAGMYVGSQALAHRAAIARIVRGGANWAMETPNRRCSFLPTGLTPFVSKMHPADAAGLLKEMEVQELTISQTCRPKAISSFTRFLDALSSRASKATRGRRGGLRNTDSRPDQQQEQPLGEPRRITFADSDAEEDEGTDAPQKGAEKAVGKGRKLKGAAASSAGTRPLRSRKRALDLKPSTAARSPDAKRGHRPATPVAKRLSHSEPGLASPDEADDPIEGGSASGSGSDGGEDAMGAEPHAASTPSSSRGGHCRIQDGPSSVPSEPAAAVGNLLGGLNLEAGQLQEPTTLTMEFISTEEQLPDDDRLMHHASPVDGQMARRSGTNARRSSLSTFNAPEPSDSEQEDEPEESDGEVDGGLIFDHVMPDGHEEAFGDGDAGAASSDSDDQVDLPFRRRSRRTFRVE